MKDATSTFTPLEQLVLHVIQAVRGNAYRTWIPDWAADLYGEEAQSIAAQFAEQFTVSQTEHTAGGWKKDPHGTHHPL